MIRGDCVGHCDAVDAAFGCGLGHGFRYQDVVNSFSAPAAEPCDVGLFWVCMRDGGE